MLELTQASGAFAAIEEYLREVSRESDHVMRPNFFVNTPDILHAYLQYGGPPAFKVRAVVAEHLHHSGTIGAARFALDMLSRNPPLRL